jgi:hypothetical protein
MTSYKKAHILKQREGLDPFETERPLARIAYLFLQLTDGKHDWM